MNEAPQETIDDLLGGAEDHFVVADRGPVRFMVLSRPQQRNAMTRAMREGFAAAMAKAATNDAVSVVVVTGAHGYFSAGVDLKENPAGANIPLFRPTPVEVAREFPKPVIAMVDGPCVTGGLELALACSFVIASDRSRFVDTHIKIGKFPGWGLSSLLPSAIGMRRARQLQITGEFIDAQRGYDWGIVNELTTAQDLLPRTLQIAGLIAACPQAAVRRYVDLSRRLEGLPLEESLAVELVTVDKIRAGI